MPRKEKKWRLPDERLPYQERQYTEDEWEFIKAMEDFKDRTGIRFPSWSDALGELKKLGYKKDA